ncbi:MAG TPA: cytochrome c oxidase accessory protein CcoG [Pseudomonadales bacterium]|jgi:cytochrome c oxidase accessory protein FixG|nr:cytochrome c oxidase accessory protein CcoG [Pseudomonadales bacterium]
MNSACRGSIIATDANAAGFAPVDLYQRREKIFTRAIEGRFQRIRLYSGWPLLIGYFGLPWLDWGGRQAVLFDLPTRHFYVFGLTFWPQDFMLLAWLLIIAAFALFTVTSVVGRLWCGYTCPQTVWTAIFMWVEQITEGPRHARIRLDRAPMSLEKVGRRGAKHALWLGWAFATGLTFIGYFTPIRALTVDIATLHADLMAAAWVAFFTIATYVNAGWMREQVCLHMCPYARFQSAMFDTDTLIVSYDPARGEPRGARKRGVRPDALGDCIDCQLCVQVCPTGIDIRNGLQYECIGCAHCIDACDEVMTKVGYAPGLIRYTTHNALEGKPIRVLRPRVIGYATALSAMVVAFTIALFSRDLVGIDVIRDRGALFQANRDAIRNDYTLKVINKTQQAQTLALSVASASYDPHPRLEGPASIVVDAGDVVTVPVTLAVPPSEIGASPFDVRFEVCDAARHCDAERSEFFGPARK